MSLKFETRFGNRVILKYEPQDWDARWVWSKLRIEGRVRIAKVFWFERSDLLSEPPGDDAFEDVDGYVYRFGFGSRRDGYRRIPGRILGIDRDVLISSDLPLEKRLFSAHRDVSIFGRLAAVMPKDREIVIGGSCEDAIPVAAFEGLLAKFPTTTELNRYARARVAYVLGKYVSGMVDERRHYEAYLSRRMAILSERPIGTTELLESELAKFILIRDMLKGWLASAEVRVERDWQNLLKTFLLLIFPKYVAILENVRIDDSYSRPGRVSRRFVDIALVDAAGNLDIIEIKRPHGGGLLAYGDYRDNGFPSRELSGTVMQAEKYLFHLSKWGVAGERALTKRHGGQLPTGMTIRVTNPKAMVILGRDPDDGITGERAVDLEVVKRKYANMVDIMTYDDLLRRLENVIMSLRRRLAEQADL